MPILLVIPVRSGFRNKNFRQNSIVYNYSLRLNSEEEGTDLNFKYEIIISIRKKKNITDVPYKNNDIKINYIIINSRYQSP